MNFLTDKPCTWFHRWVYRVWADCSAFDFSHVVDIPIYGNRLWYALTLLLRSDCWGCSGILDLIELTWIFHTNHVKRVNGIWKIPLLPVSSFLRSWFSLLGYLSEINWPHMSLILRMTMDVISAIFLTFVLVLVFWPGSAHIWHIPGVCSGMELIAEANHFWIMPR